MTYRLNGRKHSESDGATRHNSSPAWNARQRGGTYDPHSRRIILSLCGIHACRITLYVGYAILAPVAKSDIKDTADVSRYKRYTATLRHTLPAVAASSLHPTTGGKKEGGTTLSCPLAGDDAITLFPMMLVRDGELLAPMSTAGCEHPAAVLC